MIPGHPGLIILGLMRQINIKGETTMTTREERVQIILRLTMYGVSPRVDLIAMMFSLKEREAYDLVREAMERRNEGTLRPVE